MLIVLIDEMSDEFVVGLHNIWRWNKNSRRRASFGIDGGLCFCVAVVAYEDLAILADMGGDGGDAGGVFFGDSDGVFMEPAEAEDDGLLDPTNAHFHITLQKAGLHFHSAFGTFHDICSFGNVLIIESRFLLEKEPLLRAVSKNLIISIISWSFRCTVYIV